jgi:hypothetical protein
MDDMLVMSMTFEQYLLDLEDFFYVPNQYQIKLNPLKYVFSIRGGRFLGFLVSSKGINDSLAISKKSLVSYMKVGYP